MKFIALDYGLKKTGIATAEAALKIPTIKNSVGSDKLLKVLENEIFKDGDIFIVGLPISMSGRYSTQTFKTIDFAIKLKNKFNSEVYLVDERLTTQNSYLMTKDFLNSKKAKKKKDENSALIILQRYLANPANSIKLASQKEYKIEYDESYNDKKILIDNVIIKNSKIYSIADVYATDPYIFWWYFKRNVHSTTLESDLEPPYDIIFNSKEVE
ncbi:MULTISPECIES: Holliday junction resolvase RuvX [unclassified Marinitoga]|uniref:Holliday junction resolvase RuvX n=1 Tax=unclassified Marinitoga TaxID=2640159 RepID=UPI0009530170|nr:MULTISPECIES: Holliday junction resolvase RuvX [unclassified Marinitoga]